MKENGKMIRHMDMGFIIILMELVMKGIGLKISSIIMEMKVGLMEADMKGIMIWGRNMGKVCLFGLMNLLMRVSFLITMLLFLYFF